MNTKTAPKDTIRLGNIMWVPNGNTYIEYHRDDHNGKWYELGNVYARRVYETLMSQGVK